MNPLENSCIIYYLFCQGPKQNRGVLWGNFSIVSWPQIVGFFRKKKLIKHFWPKHRGIKKSKIWEKKNK